MSSESPDTWTWILKGHVDSYCFSGLLVKPTILTSFLPYIPWLDHCGGNSTADNIWVLDPGYIQKLMFTMVTEKDAWN